MTVLLIAASPSARSRSSALLQAAGERLQHLGLAPRTLRLRELPAQPLLHADASDPAVRDALDAVAQARVVVLSTPIYKAAYSGLLKVFLDLLPQDGLKDKTVWSLASGGSPAHLAALDYALLPVLSALGARRHIDGVYAVDAQLPRQPDGEVLIADDIARRLTAGAAQVIAQLPQPAAPALDRTPA